MEDVSVIEEIAFEDLPIRSVTVGNGEMGGFMY